MWLGPHVPRPWLPSLSLTMQGALVEPSPAVPPVRRVEPEDSSATSTWRRRGRLVVGYGLVGLSMLAVAAASWAWTLPASRLVDCESRRPVAWGVVGVAVGLAAVGLVALLCTRWLLGRDADPPLTAHRWFLPGLAVLGFPLLALFPALAAGRPSCGHSMVVALALSLTVYWPVVTVMLPGYRGVRPPDVQRTRRAAGAGALFLALWGLASLVLEVA